MRNPSFHAKKHRPLREIPPSGPWFAVTRLLTLQYRSTDRSHPYSSRWATVAFYLEQDTPPSSSEDPNASSAPTVRWRPHLLEVASRRTSSHWAPIRLVLIAPFRGFIVSDKMIRNFGDHAANERTFLAWVRTAIAVMAFGFLVEKFDPGQKFADIAGLALIVLGTAMVAIAATRFLTTAKTIDSEEWRPSPGSRVDLALAALLVLLGS